GSARLFVTPTSVNKKWGPSGITGATSNSNGEANTALLSGLAGSYEAANYCADLTAHGHDDWYLPAVNELWPLCFAEDVLGIIEHGNWTSTDDSSSRARVVEPTFGCQTDNSPKSFT